MAAKKRSKAKRSVLRDAADALASIEKLRVQLENGEEVTLDVAKELEIPTDLGELVAAGRRAPAQLAFWGYQMERALGRLRKAEEALAREEGRQYLVYRRWYESEECVEPTEAMVRSRVDQDAKVRPFRIALRARKQEYGALRAVRDAVNHRVSMVRTLIGKSEPT
jgi:hypothetical protein